MRVGPKSQLKIVQRSNGDKFLQYTENTSKTNQGGLKHRKVTRKVVNAYPNTENPDRCPVAIYEKYVSHMPSADHNAFYLRPLQKPAGSNWFSKQPVGKQTLAKKVVSMCQTAGIAGHRTNHSLRSTAATRLYETGADEQIICEITGHRSGKFIMCQ